MLFQGYHLVHNEYAKIICKFLWSYASQALLSILFLQR